MEIQMGDRLYAAHTETERNEVVCPVCNGDKEIKITLGDGTEVMVNCTYCAPGFDPPRGWVFAEYVAQAYVKEIEVQGIRMDQSDSETELQVQYGSRLYDVDRYIGQTYEEAWDKAQLLVEKQNKQYADKFEATSEKAKKDKSYSWHVGYHMRAAKQAREEAERHEASARLMEAKIPKHLRKENE